MHFLLRNTEFWPGGQINECRFKEIVLKKHFGVQWYFFKQVEIHWAVKSSNPTCYHFNGCTITCTSFYTHLPKFSLTYLETLGLQNFRRLKCDFLHEPLKKAHSDHHAQWRHTASNENTHPHRHTGGWPTEVFELRLRPGAGQEEEDERGRGGGGWWWTFTSSVSAVRRVDHTNSMMATKTAMMRPQIRTTKIPPMFSMPRPETHRYTVKYSWVLITYVYLMQY